MNKLQRFLLFLFSSLILFHSASMHSSLIDIYLGLFFSAVLLLLATSPSRWFSKQSIPATHSERLMVLVALLKLRSAEIANSYSTIREYQDRVGNEGNWIALFMKEFSTSINDPWAEYSEEKEKKIEGRALEKFNEHYKFCLMAPLDFYRNRIKDVKIALLFWSVGTYSIVQKLKSLKEFGIMHEHIEKFIKLYNRLGKGGFFASFGNDPRKFFVRFAYDQIHLAWAQVLKILEMHIHIEKMKNASQERINLDDLLKEIEALRDLEVSFDLAVTQKNRKRLGSSALKENEILLLSKLKDNPMHYHS
jgi:hypothetical protein